MSHTVPDEATAMSDELDKLLEKLNARFADTPLGAAAVAAAVAAAKPGDGVAQDQGNEAKAAPVSDVDSPNNHADLKELAKKLRRPLDTLYALSASNDPLMVDQAFRVEGAQWFIELYGRLKIRAGIHIRRIFYQLVSQPNLLRSNGKRFENTVECSNKLIDVVRDARYRELIPAGSIIDRRNPSPTINGSGSNDDMAAEVEILGGQIESREFGESYRAPTYNLPSLSYSEPSIGQRYHLEIWIEKSTANDVLLPLGIQFGINIVTFVGEVSVTACEDLVNRAIASGRPVRIFHITDFDPAGRSMPVAAAVKIDFFAKKSGHPLDIRLEHVALTPEQCVQYQLPRTPIKKSELRGAKFEGRFGAGQTELDALEALHPGVLRQILLGHIERYIDADLNRSVEEAVDRFKDELDRITAEIRDSHADEIAYLDEQRKAIDLAFEQVRNSAQATYEAAVEETRRAYFAAQAQASVVFRQTLEQARDEITGMQRSYIEQAEPLIATMASELEEAVPDDFDWPEPAEVDEDGDDTLYASTRGYVEQVDRFRRHQRKDSDVRFARDRVFTKTCAECNKPFSARTDRQTVCGRSICLNKRNYRLRLERERRTNKTQTGKK
jgi:hypothetical protein